MGLVVLNASTGENTSIRHKRDPVSPCICEPVNIFYWARRKRWRARCSLCVDPALRDLLVVLRSLYTNYASGDLLKVAVVRDAGEKCMQSPIVIQTTNSLTPLSKNLQSGFPKHTLSLIYSKIPRQMAKKIQPQLLGRISNPKRQKMSKEQPSCRNLTRQKEN